MKSQKSRLTRPRYPMPDYIRQPLEKHQLMDQYKNRPPYQQNDYIGWITRAKKEETREKRLQQMLYELKDGGLYMKMKYNPQRIKKKQKNN